MAQWSVKIVRIGYASRIFLVDAEDEDQAKRLAMDTAGNYEFSEHTSIYELDWAAPTHTAGGE